MRLFATTALFLALAAPASAATLGKRVVEKGDKGPDIEILQRVLTLKGYAVGGADGVFGRQTKVAVKAFQKRRGLQQDGRVGPATTQALASTWKISRATLFGPGLYGNKTACGFTLTHHTRGIAHRSLPCGTPVAVYHDGLIALYPVIDRGPFADGIDLDVTAAAASQLRMTTTTDLRAGH